MTRGQSNESFSLSSKMKSGFEYVIAKLKSFWSGLTELFNKLFFTNPRDDSDVSMDFPEVMEVPVAAPEAQVDPFDPILQELKDRSSGLVLHESELVSEPIPDDFVQAKLQHDGNLQKLYNEKFPMVLFQPQQPLVKTDVSDDKPLLPPKVEMSACGKKIFAFLTLLFLYEVLSTILSQDRGKYALIYPGIL